MANDTSPKFPVLGRAYESIDTAKTLANADYGVVQNCIKTVTITLPATAVGASVTIRNAGGAVTAGGAAGAVSDGKVTITVAPNSVDKIEGLGFTATDNKAAINTLGNIGDEITLVADGVDGWMVISSKGLWTRAA